MYAQVNRALLDEFAALVANAVWSACLLQEVPPSWRDPLASRCGAQALRTLTSRNQLLPLTQRLAHWNPDLIGSWEGGSNLILVRPPWRLLAGSARELLLNPLRERGPFGERRRMTFTRIRAETGGGRTEVCIANLHATAGRREQAERELRRTAAAAVGWADGTALVVGGDFNLRPASSPGLFTELERRFGLAGPTCDECIDHLLSRGISVVRAPVRWEPARRELQIPWDGGTRRLRLSDHAPVEGVFDSR